MKDLTNLNWPEEPFGAGQRPFGKASKLLCGFDLQPAEEPPGVLGCVATVYVRVDNGVAAPVESATLPVGFRVSVIEDPADAEALLEILDLTLSRARRHAVILAGHHLDTSLRPLVHAGAGSWPGVTAILGAWPQRPTTAEGFAQLVDTADEAPAGRLDVDLTVLDVPTTAADPLDLAQATLARCLAVALQAGASQGRLRWQGRFSVEEALRCAGWDLLEYRKTAT